MGEPGDGLTPRPPRASRRRIALRRIVALAAALALVAAGVYLVVSLGFSPRHVAATAPAATPPPKPFRVVFPEGFTRAQMAERVQAVARIAHRERGVHPRLSAKTYLAASGPRRIPGFGPQKRPLEGFLFPATYEFLARTTSRELVAAQLAAFRRIWSTVDLSYARSRNLTPYDVLIIASMVEKEAQVPSERPKIAAVIYNRLRAHMPLGIDATIRYGLHVPPTRSLTTSDLASDNPYNTRKLLGLPPTPIANPGLAAIQAAAHPARVDYLYFLRKPDRRHHYFTRSFDDFIAHEKAYGY
ncbi:MAG: endolytic transglycosylase MltG [Thermoleophilia bacterium]|nr:endolytic transglycosylase MltG [Thermoleophilia bacterium]